MKPPVTGPYRISHHRLASTPVRQGEILSDLFLARRVFRRQEEIAFEQEVRPLAIILTQDCDLDQDHRVRFVERKTDSDKLIPCVLLAELHPATDTLARIAKGNKKEWERLNIARNGNPRFQFLEQVPAEHDRLGDGLPELVIDFKRYFAVATDELYFRVGSGETQRRCVLTSPYLEHLSHRFAHYLGRVGLPTDHVSKK